MWNCSEFTIYFLCELTRHLFENKFLRSGYYVCPYRFRLSPLVAIIKKLCVSLFSWKPQIVCSVKKSQTQCMHFAQIPLPHMWFSHFLFLSFFRPAEFSKLWHRRAHDTQKTKREIRLPVRGNNEKKTRRDKESFKYLQCKIIILPKTSKLLFRCLYM